MGGQVQVRARARSVTYTKKRGEGKVKYPFFVHRSQLRNLCYYATGTSAENKKGGFVLSYLALCFSCVGVYVVVVCALRCDVLCCVVLCCVALCYVVGESGRETTTYQNKRNSEALQFEHLVLVLVLVLTTPHYTAPAYRWSRSLHVV
jgi:hypothetical protein